MVLSNANRMKFSVQGANSPGLQQFVTSAASFSMHNAGEDKTNSRRQKGESRDEEERK